MRFATIVFYFLSLGTAAAMIVNSYKLLKQYGYKFLNYYFYYIVFFYVFGFLNFTGRLMVARIFAPFTSTMQIASQLVAVTALPLFVISIYFALSWIRELVGKRIPGTLKGTYWSIQALVVATYFWAVTNLGNSKAYSLTDPIFQVVTGLELLIVLVILVQIYSSSPTLADNTRKRLARGLGHLYLACYSAAVIFGAFIQIPFHVYPRTLALQIVVTFLFFFINIPPLLYLNVFLKKNHGKWGIRPPDPARLADFYTRYDISGREQEIIALIIKGKTNEEIGDELFLSTKTVKNYVSNIYKKTAVKNRVQLTNLLRD